MVEMSRFERIEERVNMMVKRDISSFMLYGKRGLGKTSLGKKVAKKILCVSDEEDSCGCQSCKAFDAGTHPDFVLIEDKRIIRKEEVMIIEERIKKAEVISERLVVMIDDADGMTEAAQNALLKSLEDDGERVCFIMTAEKRLLDTIHSRVIQYDFSTLSLNEFLLERPNDLDLSTWKLMFALSTGSPGIANRIRSHENFNVFFEGIKDVTTLEENVLSKLGLVKEKSSNNYFEVIKEFRFEFLMVLKAYFIHYLIASRGEKSEIFGVIDTSILSVESVMKILSKVNAMVRNYNKLTVNDFIGLVFYMNEERRFYNAVS